MRVDSYETIVVERRGRVGSITLHRPSALNALNFAMMREMTEVCTYLDRDRDTGCILLKGSTEVFAAGADLKEIRLLSYGELQDNGWFAGWDQLRSLGTPLIAAVAGLAIGGGCELAMLCDIIVAADTARFGQPEVQLALMPGMGGCQRLARVVGKAKAMELCLTGRTMGAEEAERSGLVARVVSADDLDAEAWKLAHKIASMSKPVTRSITESIDNAFETGLSQAVRVEREEMRVLLAALDRVEGIAAFEERRAPKFSHL
jgi:enoyl-CoA hydratase